MPSAIFGHSTTGVEVVKQYPAQIKNKTFVITGTSEGGTGAEAAIALSHGSPAHIFLLARSETKVTPVIDQIHSTSPQTQTHYFPIVSTVILYVQRFSTCRSKSRTNTILHASRVGDCVPSVLTPETLESLAIEGRGASLPCLASAIVTPIQLDNFDSVRYAAAEVNKLVPRVDVIINSAGMMHENFSLNPDGIETTFAANYLGHFLLTSCLMHRVAGVRSDTRVVNVASNGHDGVKDGTYYHRWAGYGQSKTAQILFTCELAARGIQAYSLHPGLIMGTGTTASLDASEGEVCAEVARRYTGNEYTTSKPKNVHQGCATALVAALDPGLAAKSGAYLEDCQIAQAYKYATAPQKALELWKLSEKLIGHGFDSPTAR